MRYMSIDATGKDLIAHWQRAASKGLMNKNTAQSWAFACDAVLSSVEGADSLDVRKIDVDDVVLRFTHLRHDKYSPSVLTTYAGRFRRALESYLKYLNDPGAWRPKSRAPRAKSAEKATKTATTATSATSAHVISPASVPSASEDRALVVDYPFPLRPGVMVHLYLPRDLKRREIKRLTTFMEAVASEDEENTPG
jgi:hypothetical protein